VKFTKQGTPLLGISAAALLAIFMCTLFVNGNVTTNSLAAAEVKSGESMTGDANNSQNSTIRVQVGGGNATMLYTAFIPAKVEIEVGQTVSWYNPTLVSEPHTVTFFHDQSQWGNITSELVTGDRELSGANSNSSNSVIQQASAQGTSAAGNQVGAAQLLDYFKGAFAPKVIKEDGTEVALPANATYSADGSERYINSGWIWPQGQAPGNVLNTNSFSVRFDRQGTFDYMCLLHPWMSGQVIVK